MLCDKLCTHGRPQELRVAYRGLYSLNTCVFVRLSKCVGNNGSDYVIRCDTCSSSSLRDSRKPMGEFVIVLLIRVDILYAVCNKRTV